MQRRLHDLVRRTLHNQAETAEICKVRAAACQADGPVGWGRGSRSEGVRSGHAMFWYSTRRTSPAIIPEVPSRDGWPCVFAISVDQISIDPSRWPVVRHGVGPIHALGCVPLAS
jgi:hypothetical protein